MDTAEFNALQLRTDTIVRVNMKPDDQIKSPGLYGRGTNDKPRAGYITGMAESGYIAFMLISTLPRGGGGGYTAATVEDTASIEILGRSEEGRLLQIADREDGKGTQIVREVSS